MYFLDLIRNSNLYNKFSQDFVQQLIMTLLTFLFIWLIRSLILFIVNKRTHSPYAKYNWNRYSYYVMWFLIIVVEIDIWLKGFGQIITLLGFLAAGIAIALKEPIVNLFGWFFTVWNGSFRIGDRIEIANHKGDVIEIGLFQFKLMELHSWVDGDQYTGRILYIPNSKIFTEVKANYNTVSDYVWHEFDLSITFESNWKKAKEIIYKIVNEKSEHNNPDAIRDASNFFEVYKIENISFEPVIYNEIYENGIKFTVRYFCDFNLRRVSEMEINELIIEEFSKNKDIMFAYQTMRLYNNRIEGKEGTKEL
jgi:small-conductance mechanosensitive channel